MSKSDYITSVVFYKGNPIHYHQFNQIIDDGEEIIITQVVDAKPLAR